MITQPYNITSELQSLICTKEASRHRYTHFTQSFTLLHKIRYCCRAKALQWSLYAFMMDNSNISTSSSWSSQGFAVADLSSSSILQYTAVVRHYNIVKGGSIIATKVKLLVSHIQWNPLTFNFQHAEITLWEHGKVSPH